MNGIETASNAKHELVELEPHTPRVRRKKWYQPDRSNSQYLYWGVGASQHAHSTPAGLKHKVSFLWDMISGVDLLVVFLVSSAITICLNKSARASAWLSFLSESKSAIATLGAFYSFALVFRTNICYARWWEGRTLWGTIIVGAIRITQQGRLWIDDDALFDRLCCLAITFSYACKAHLRGNSIKDEDEDGAKLVCRGILTQEELDAIDKFSSWQPYYCIDAMRAVTNAGLKAERDERCFDWMKNSAHRAMEDTICVLSSSIGGCIRVRSTGLPVSYDDILYTTGGIFFTMATVAWAPGVGLYNPIVVLVAYVTVKMIIGLGNDLEDPFGHDESDLPLEKFCETVEKQINAIEERTESIAYDLAYGPTSTPNVHFDKSKDRDIEA
ncbi:hypothetical protein ACHAWF_003060, partial [Thalassiosira exigua]